ncbi:hypothetical protein CL616_01310 [archaeon]|nr:hypothetical protein [archaeon]
MASEETTEIDQNPKRDYAKHGIALRLIDHFMERYELTQEDSIGDLIDGIKREMESMKDKAKEHFEVETDEELKQAIKANHIEKLREYLNLDDSYTNQEVLEIAAQERVDLLRELLDLPEDMSDDEVREALQNWKQDNKVLMWGFMPRITFFKGFF